MTVQMTPLLTSAVAGVVDGAIVKNDSDNGRVETSKQWATWYEAALLAGGLLLGMGGMYQFGHFAEPLTGAGAALLGSRLTLYFMKQGTIPSTMMQGASIPRASFVPTAYAGSVHKQPTETLT